MKNSTLLLTFLGFASWAALMWRVGSIPGIREAVAEFRASGFAGLVRKYGWKLGAGFVAFYLIRDATLYLLIPWLAATGLLSL